MPAIKFSVQSNLREKVSQLDAFERTQVPFATALALTRTMKLAQVAEIAEMRAKFDRPTSYTLGGTYVSPATKSHLEASIKLKDEAGKGTPAAKYLEPEVEGGGRGHKHFELALIRAGVMPSDMYAVPGSRAPLDAYGNIPGPFIEQMLSAIGASETISGHTSDRTTRSRRRNPTRAEYFVGRPGNGRGPLGIWERVGRGARPIIIFVRSPAYRPRDDFFGVAQRVVEEQYEAQWDQALAEAVASALP